MRLPFFPRFRDFEKRWDGSELMDDADADIDLLLKTIGQFSLINATIGGTARRFEKWFLPLMAEDRSYRVIDVGSGGGDVPVAIVKAARRRGVKLQVLALDRDERILPLAREATREFPEIEVRAGEARDLPALGPVDVVICNHLLHHLREDEIGDFLASANEAASLGILLDDLLRSPWSWLGYGLFASIFARGSFAMDDGRLSILRGFRTRELEGLLAGRPSVSGVEVFRASPGRIGFSRIGPVVRTTSL